MTKKKSTLSDFAKEIIRDCAKQKTSIYETHVQVLRFCLASNYTIKEVGKYLRYVRKAILRDHELSAKTHELSLNVPHVTDYLPVQPHELSKKFEKVRCESTLRRG